MIQTKIKNDLHGYIVYVIFTYFFPFAGKGNYSYKEDIVPKSGVQ